MKPAGEDYGFDELPARLLKVIPEIAEKYQEELRYFGPEAFGQHIVFSDVFNPYLIDLLESNDDRDKIDRAFELIEEMARHEDAHILEVVYVTICRRLISNSLLGRAWNHMGEKTRELTWQRVTHHPEVVDRVKFDEAKYLEAWKREVEALGGIENLTIDALLSIRRRLFPEFGIKVYPRA